MHTPPPPPARAGASVLDAPWRSQGAPLQASPAPTSVSTPIVPVALLGLTFVITISLLLAAVARPPAQASDLSVGAASGWIVGGLLVCPLLFAWFRSTDAGRQTDPLYVEPSWRPRRVAVLLAAFTWMASVGCAVVIAASLARR